MTSEGSYQHAYDDPRFPTVHNVVRLVAEALAAFEPGHGGGVWVSSGSSGVGGPLPGSALEGAVLCSVARNPVSLESVLLLEGRILGCGQDRQRSGWRGRRHVVRRLGELSAHCWLFFKEFAQVCFDGPPRCQRIYRGITLNLGRVEKEFVSPYQPCFDALLHDPLEEASEHRKPKPLTGTG